MRAAIAAGDGVITFSSRSFKVFALSAFSCCSMWLKRAIADIDHCPSSVMS